jgi:Tol biopolymer transport system component
MPSAGGAPHQVFRATGWRNGARYSLGWSRDQRYLIFVRPEGDASKPQLLWRVPLQGGDPEKMGISMPDIFFPQMSPDGRRIAFTSREDAAEEVWALENFLPKVGSR